jgi:hypothetical protein
MDGALQIVGLLVVLGCCIPLALCGAAGLVRGLADGVSACISNIGWWAVAGLGAALLLAS